MSAPVMSNAGRYGTSCSTVFSGAWMMTTGWSGSSCLQRLVATNEPCRADPRLAAERVARLVDSLPREEPG